MLRKTFTLLVFSFIAFAAAAQEKAYDFPAPQGWQTEKFSFPLKFAPLIPYHGTEELHLTPGWGKAESHEYWSYVFLWYLDGSVKITTAQLRDYLQQYYTGLYLSNLGRVNRMCVSLSSP